MLLFFPLRLYFILILFFFFFCSEVQAQCPVPTHPTAIPTQPTCTVRTGIITVNNPAPATGVIYSMNATDFKNTTGIFSDLVPGTYVVTVNYGAGCISLPLNVTINPPPPVPPQPSATSTQPSCTVTTGTITLTPAPATGISYSIDGTDYSNTTGVFSGLAPNTYTVTVKNSYGCISPALNVTVNAPPPVPTQPVAVPSQPNCTIASGTITVTSPAPAPGISYSINGTDYTNTTGNFSGLAPNTYSLTVKNSYGCTSPARIVMINAPPPVPTQPIATSTSSTCAVATGTITVTSPAPATGIAYSINGTDYTNTTGIFNKLAPGTYSVTAKNSAGCVSPVQSVTVNPSSSTLAATARAADIACGQSSTTITVNVTGGTAPFTYSLNGATAVSTNSFPGIAAGSYKITVKDAVGCSVEAGITIKQITCLPIPGPKVFVPTAFTPNNNNQNDNLQPYLLNIRELTYFKVYNRWGQLVFQTNTIGKGWDGNINGIQQPVETYTWILACIDIDGKVIKQSGRSLLIR